jgi:hypothetical protein
MKLLLVFVALFTTTCLQAQPMPHGMVYGVKPGTIGRMDATKLEAFMGKRVRIGVVLLSRIVKVTKPKGGWFQLDAGRGRVINAHFKNYDITIPKALQGRRVIVEGIAQKQFIADDMQHLAGDPVTKPKPNMKPATKPVITFEVTGIMVN